MLSESSDITQNGLNSTENSQNFDPTFSTSQNQTEPVQQAQVMVYRNKSLMITAGKRL